MSTTPTDLTAVVDAAQALAWATRYEEALRLLDATRPVADADRLAILVARAEVAGRRDHARGARSGDGHPLDAALALAAELGTGPSLTWDLAMLHLRRQYADQIVDGIGPAGRDLTLVAAMTAEATRLRDVAADDARRGWAAMCLGWFADNLRGDRAEAPGHYAEALALGRRTGDPLLVFEAQRHLGDHAHDAGDHAAALAAWQESAAAAARGGHVLGVLAQQVLLAVLARDAHEEAAAVLLATETRRWADAVGAARLRAQCDDLLAGGDPTAPPPGAGD